MEVEENVAEQVEENTQQEQEKEQERERLAARMSQPDAIMNKDTTSNLFAFISHGGAPETAVRLLSESYVGYASMVNLCVDWIDQIDDSEATGRAEGGTSQAASSSSSSSSSSMEVESARKKHSKGMAVVEDHVFSLIKAKFDPGKADTVFQDKRSAPAWLTQMTHSKKSRQLVYDLIERHKHCLLLNFAIQRVSEAGYFAEISSASTAAAFFGVFNGVVTESLSSIIDSNDEDELQLLLPNFVHMASANQHTYLYSQTMVQELIRRTGNDALRRLSQELEQHSAQHGGKMVWRLNGMLTHLNEYTELVEIISSVLSTGQLHNADIMSLAHAYSGKAGAPPPVRFLRHPMLLDIILHNLFRANNRLGNDLVKNHMYVLAYASCVPDFDGGESYEDEREERDVEGGVYLTSRIKKEVRGTVEALKETWDACMSNNTAGADLGRVASRVGMHLTVPIVAAALVNWTRESYTDPSFYAKSMVTNRLRTGLDVLAVVADLHPGLHPRLLQLYRDAFVIEKPDIDSDEWLLEVEAMLLDAMLHLALCGHVLPVMRCMNDLAATTDQSLLRDFIGNLLQAIEAPFSHEFAAAMVRLMTNSTKTLQALSLRRAIVDRFIDDVQGMNMDTDTQGRLLLLAQQ